MAGIPWARKEGRKNSLRFSLRSREGPEIWTRDKFKLFLIRFFDLRFAEVMCLQDFVKRGVFELTLVSGDLCLDLWKMVQERKEEAPLNLFHVEPMFAGQLLRMTVWVSDPFVSEEEIASFLRRYVVLQAEGKKDLDNDGVWAGKWTFWVRLYMDIARGEGVVHPPAFFGNGSRRGYLVYPGQPLMCRRCGEGGHYAVQCTTALCSRCQSRDHVTRDCVYGVRCLSGGKVGFGDVHCQITGTKEWKGNGKRTRAVAAKSRSVESVRLSDTDGDSEDGVSENGAVELVSAESVRSSAGSESGGTVVRKGVVDGGEEERRLSWTSFFVPLTDVDQDSNGVVESRSVGGVRLSDTDRDSDDDGSGNGESVKVEYVRKEREEMRVIMKGRR
ncbi:ZCHC3 protein, partial [Atractosteus spatula]|nr:ZCHC3 protein [Atractosteus spatula]